MKIEDYKFVDCGLYIKFDRTFKHIKLQKLENTNKLSCNTSDNLTLLDYDSIELTFSKDKNSITLHTFKDCNIVIIILLEVDKQDINHQSFMFMNKEQLTKKETVIDKEQLLGYGLEHIFSGNLSIGGLKGIGGNKKVLSNDKTLNKNDIRCEIKNENIFAEIKRR